MSLLLAVAGVLMIAGGIFAWTRASAENKTRGSWLPAQGVVRSTHIRDEWEGSGSERRHIHTITVNFNYTVNGKDFSGNVYSENPSHFAALGAKYREGAAVTVFYNPQNPSHHDIKEPLARSGNLTTGKIAFFLIILGVIALAGAAVT